VTYDLEDSVTEHLKPDARKALKAHLNSLPSQHGFGEVAVRINALSTRHALDDINAAVSSPAVGAIVIPKVQSAADIALVEDILRLAAPQRPVKLLALIESAKAVVNLHAICAASPMLRGLIFAAEDYSLDMSLIRSTAMTEMLYARSAVATAARAFDMESAIDVVCTKFRGAEAEQAFLEECRNGKSLGFNGKREGPHFWNSRGRVHANGSCRVHPS
jgi:citrate lyase subunit beta-like protein